jgi:Flp pilus assembly protein TadG
MRDARTRTPVRARPRRRGAVLVMATAMMAGLMVVTAIAVDLSRLFVLRTELQTAADAAALAAARQLVDDPTRAAGQAVSLAHGNSTLAGTPGIDSVRFGMWRRSTRTFVPGNPITADAVQVTVGRSTSYLLARFFSTESVRVTARAVAWAGAPAMRTCVIPLFILHHDYMEALGKAHEDMLTHEDVWGLRDAAKRRPLRLTLRNQNLKPRPGLMYGMVLPSHNSGQSPRRGAGAYRQNFEECNPIKRGWVAETERVDVTRTQTLPSIDRLCHPLRNGLCYSEKGDGSIGVPVTVSVFCTGPEHQGGNMWFQVEWMTGLMIETVRPTPEGVQITGYLIPTQGTGEVPPGEEPTGLVRTILVR